MKARTVVQAFAVCCFCAVALAEQGGQQIDWKQNWAGSAINRALTPVGKTVLLEGFEAATVEAAGQAASASENYRFSSVTVRGTTG
jgi:hypothetical protein